MHTFQMQLHHRGSTTVTNGHKHKTTYNAKTGGKRRRGSPLMERIQLALPFIVFLLGWTALVSYFVLSRIDIVSTSNFADDLIRSRNIQQHQPLPPSDEIILEKASVPRFDEMPNIGDKSQFYRLLRAEYDSKFPETPDAITRRQHLIHNTLHKRTYEPIRTGGITYDVHDCPPVPPPGYPFAWPMMEVLNHWGPDDTTPREEIYQGLCVFDFQNDLDKAFAYRDAEVPFVIRNDPQVMRTVERWAQPEYLSQLMPPDETHRAEYSETNHFMYWMMGRGGKKGGKRGGGNQKVMPADWKPPTEMIRMTYQDWLTKANVTDESRLGPDNPHWYFRLIGCGADVGCDRKSQEFLFDELPFFQPKRSLYMVQPGRQKGIHCRFGMKGVIAENHFDGSRNYIALLGGERRYILAHPNQCELLALLPKEHPSGRHSAVDWSDPDLETYPQFAQARSNEVVMQAGDVLYLPTHWFHYIVSLDLNFQCNTRSGIGQDYMKIIRQCGF